MRQLFAGSGVKGYFEWDFRDFFLVFSDLVAPGTQNLQRSDFLATVSLSFSGESYLFSILGQVRASSVFARNTHVASLSTGFRRDEVGLTFATFNMSLSIHNSAMETGAVIGPASGDNQKTLIYQ